MVAVFAVIMTIASVLGVADIAMFQKVDEPPVTPSRATGFWESFLAPMQLPSFRSYIGFMSYWHLASMVGAPFISLYLLEHVGMKLWQVLALWTVSWVGGAVFSQFLGRQAELHGNKAVLKVCVVLKPINMFCLILAPQDATLAFWTLLPMFMLDARAECGDPDCEQRVPAEELADRKPHDVHRLGHCCRRNGRRGHGDRVGVCPDRDGRLVDVAGMHHDHRIPRAVRGQHAAEVRGSSVREPHPGTVDPPADAGLFGSRGGRFGLLVSPHRRRD